MLERQELEAMLAEGCSLEQIGRRVGRHPSTASYWLRKHGLRANQAQKHGPRGGLAAEDLVPLVTAGRSIREIAEALGVSGGTVRHWLSKYGLRTSGKRGRPAAHAARQAGLTSVELECSRHGPTTFVLEPRGYYRCLKCRSEGVAARRRRVKEILVAEAGGSCRLCGYSSYTGALHFHHLDPNEKAFGLAVGGVARSLERCRAEVRKCVLLCSNCHAEVEGGFTTLPA